MGFAALAIGIQYLIGCIIEIIYIMSTGYVLTHLTYLREWGFLC